ncbi:MAG: PAS domain-containing methyl-accepting chemotaxis protein [Bacteriovorax sp.]|nr:PAS domain-containing methyl-accepting chemotaxis protein [Bacteriovorax sp.]
MRRPAPTQNETTFGLDEMFFSTTDHRGVILDGNEVFIRISKYSREELIGAPHNIIRHPDMPKIVFKALWDTILAGKTICAYVKNLAKDGSYYWVFATVIPIGNDFLSIRLKSTTHLKEIVEGLYKELLTVEKSSGVDASLKVLVSSLNSLGFPDYDSFSLAAISAELSSRHALQSKKLKTNSNIASATAIINPLYLSRIRESLFKIFTLINKLSTHTNAISDKITKIGDVSKNIEFSALNTIIEAERLGDQGRALGAVAQHISAGAAETKKLNSNVNLLATKMLGNLGEFRTIQLSIALSTLQVEMLSCFVEQWTADTTSISEEGFKKNYLMLTTLISESLNQAKPIILSLGEDTQLISSEIENTFQVLKILNFIQRSGSIESARLSDDSIFSHLFLAIKNLINESEALYAEFSAVINDVIKKDVTEVIKEYEIAAETIATITIQ